MFFIKQLETISFLAPIYFWESLGWFLAWLMLFWKFFMLLETRFDFIFVLARTLHVTYSNCAKLDSHQLPTKSCIALQYRSPIMLSICICTYVFFLYFFTAVPPTQTCIKIGTVVGVAVALVVVIIIMGVVIGVLVARIRHYKLSVQRHTM